MKRICSKCGKEDLPDESQATHPQCRFCGNWHFQGSTENEPVESAEEAVAKAALAGAELTSRPTTEGHLEINSDTPKK